MAEGLPREIEPRRLVDGVAYALPRRPLGGLRWVAAGVVAFGLVFAGMPLAAAIGSLPASPGLLDLVSLALSLLFVAVGAAVSMAGLALLRGHCVIELRPAGLVATERMGPFRWRRRRATAGLQHVEVSRGTTRVNGRLVTEGTLAEMSAMIGRFESGPPFLLAFGYPESWLAAVASNLVVDLETVRPSGLIGHGPPVTVQVVRPAADLAPDETPVEKPASSGVDLQPSPDGITLTIPPAGVVKGSRGLFAFSVLWNGFMTAFTIAVITGITSINASCDTALLVTLCAGFWAIGIIMLLAAVNMGKRHAIIDVVGDVLLINRSNLFGIKSHQWPREELETVAVGPSGLEMNDVPVLELKVRPREGRPVGLFAGRDEQELRWIAWTLRDRLDLTRP